eukprot:5688471-Pyramimonas_sp.AAC.1
MASSAGHCSLFPATVEGGCAENTQEPGRPSLGSNNPRCVRLGVAVDHIHRLTIPFVRGSGVSYRNTNAPRFPKTTFHRLGLSRSFNGYTK